MQCSQRARSSGEMTPAKSRAGRHLRSRTSPMISQEWRNSRPKAALPGGLGGVDWWWGW